MSRMGRIHGRINKRYYQKSKLVCQIMAIFIVSVIFSILLHTNVSAQTTFSRKVSVLMIGNSKTMMPSNTTISNLKSMAKSSGHKISIQYISSYGEKLENWADPSCANGKRVRKMIKNTKFDFIIMQDKTDSAIFHRKSLVESCKVLASYIYKQNPDTKIIYNAIWCYKKKTRSLSQRKQQKRINKSYQKAADETGGSVVWSGAAFQRYQEVDGTKDLYLHDKNHASKYGWYLNACCIFAEIFKESPNAINFYGEIEKKQARTMQRIATELQLY